MEKLNRTLGLTECVFFGVGSILGAGIYALIGKVAGVAGNMLWLSFLIASFVAMCTAFSYAELSSMYPRSGGEFVYAKEAFGRRTGSFIGFLISLNGIVTGSVVALGFSGYFSELTGVEPVLSAFGIILIIFLVNSVGIKESSKVNILFTSIEFSGLLLVLYCALSDGHAPDYLDLPEEGFNGLMTGSILAFFAYVGFEEIVKLAEETKNPSRIIPKALFIANSIVAVIYVLVGLAVLSLMDPLSLSEAENPLAAAIETVLGKKGLIILSIIALFATSNTILSNMLGSSRVLFDMGDELKFLKPLSKIWELRQTPVPALILISLVMASFVLIGDLEYVALIATFIILLTFFLVNLSVIVLRFKAPEKDRPFKIPINLKELPVISTLGLVLILILLIFNFDHLIAN